MIRYEVVSFNINRYCYDEFLEGSFETPGEAIEAAQNLYAHWCDHDRKNNKIEVRELSYNYDEDSGDWISDLETGYNLINWKGDGESD